MDHVNQEDFVVQKPKYLIFNNFILRLIALITMTIDHIGKLISTFFVFPASSVLGRFVFVFDCLGRLSFPLFAFLSAKAILHTKSRGKYILRLGIMTAIIGITLFVSQYALEITNMDNIFLTLLLGVVTIYFFEHKNKFLKPLGALPIIYLAVLSGLQIGGVFPAAYPEALTPQYGLYGFLMILGFYYSHKLYNVFANRHDENIGNPKETTILQPNYQLTVNIIQALSLVAVNILFWAFEFFPALTVLNGDMLFSYREGMLVGPQLISIVSALFIILYNNQVGYNRRWWKYFNYAYYPLHLGVGAIICYIITLLM